MVEKVKKQKRRKILVTGSCGMLGTVLCGELANAYEVIGLDKSSDCGLKCLRQDAFIRCDITDKGHAVKSIVDAAPDAVIHAAAWTDVDGCEKNPDAAYEINAEGTGHAARACSDLGAPFIYISTDFVFDGRKKEPYTVSDKPNPLNAYGRSKLAGEKYASELRKHMILRTGWLFGPNGKNFVKTILEKAKTGNPVKVVDDQLGAPTYTTDLVKAVSALVEKVVFNTDAASAHNPAAWGVYHVSNKGAVTWYDYAREILKLCGIENGKIVSIKSSELDRPARRPAFSVLDNTRFEKMTNFVMRKWEDALREYLHAKKSQG